MGRIDNVVDVTGGQNLTQMNAENIRQIIEELNRNSDQLDALSKNLAISTKGQVVAPLVGNSYQATVTLGSGNPSSFLVFMSRPDLPGQYFAMPYFQTVGFPISGLNMACGASLSPGIAGSSTTLNMGGSVSNAYLGSAPASITFYYYVFNQPANPSGS